MSNKTDLQENNKRIEDFIAEGQELPPAMPSELGNATPADVMNGKTFTSNGGVMQTGNLAPDGFGNATPADVMSGKTFSTDEGIRQTGSLAPNGFGDAAAEDVLIGKTFTSALGIMLAGALDPDTLKIGQYVWKKYSASGKTGTISVEFSTDDYLTDHWEKVVQVSGDLTASDLTSDDFIGLNMPCTVDSGMHYITFKADGKCEGIWGGSSQKQGTYTYDPSTGIIKVYAQFGAADLFAGSIEVTKRDFLVYALSDSEDAYPDGGEQDGYWYKRYNPPLEQAGIDLSGIGYTKACVEKITPSERTTVVNHSLGVRPKFIMVTTESDEMDSYDMHHYVAAILWDQYYFEEKLIGGVFENYGYYFVGTSIDKIGSTTIDLAHYLTAGVEYTLVTMA